MRARLLHFPLLTVSGISHQISSFGDGYSIFDRKTLLLNSCSSSSCSILQINSKATDLKIFTPIEPKGESLLVLKSQGGVAMLRKQFKITQ